MTILSGRDNSLTGLSDPRRANRPIAKPAPGADPVQQFFNRAAFDLNPLGKFGTLGKGTLRGPGLVSWDMGAFKQISIGERFTAQFRAEFFNILNHPNFAGPTASVSSPSFGQTLSAQDPRIIQFGLKLLF